MTQGMYGPLWTIDGPPPKPPKYRLLDVARVIDDVDDGVDRWINGVEVYPYPTDLTNIHDACSPGSTEQSKVEGGTFVHPKFGTMTVYIAETCSTFGIFGADLSNDEAQARFVARANAVFAAVESGGIEREFLAGDVLGANPFLADGTGTFPWGNTATTPVNALAVLENEIAQSRRQGVIHMSPGVAVALDGTGIVLRDVNGTLVTVAGTPVVVGSGYAPSVAPVHPAAKSAPANALQEWIYATGPIEIRRSELILLPGSLSEAVNRSTNTVTYRAERYYVVDWDTAVHAAVLVDRCTTNCGLPS